jgi:hypothetical protein
LKLKKLEDHDTKNNNSTLRSILTDIYFSNRPMFGQQVKRGDYSGQETNSVTLRTADVKPYLSLFQKISDKALSVMLPGCSLVRLEPGQELYKENEATNNFAYLIISGQMDLCEVATGLRMGTSGAGDSLGEEVIVADPFLQSVYRQESARAVGECFAFEFDTVTWAVWTRKLKELELEMDMFTLNNYFKKQAVQKRAWRKNFSMEKKQPKKFGVRKDHGVKLTMF